MQKIRDHYSGRRSATQLSFIEETRRIANGLVVFRIAVIYLLSFLLTASTISSVNILTQ